MKGLIIYSLILALVTLTPSMGLCANGGNWMFEIHQKNSDRDGAAAICNKTERMCTAHLIITPNDTSRREDVLVEIEVGESGANIGFLSHGRRIQIPEGNFLRISLPSGANFNRMVTLLRPSSQETNSEVSRSLVLRSPGPPYAEIDVVVTSYPQL